MTAPADNDEILPPLRGATAHLLDEAARHPRAREFLSSWMLERVANAARFCRAEEKSRRGKPAAIQEDMTVNSTKPTEGEGGLNGELNERAEHYRPSGSPATS